MGLNRSLLCAQNSFLPTISIKETTRTIGFSDKYSECYKQSQHQTLLYNERLKIWRHLCWLCKKHK